MNPCVLDHISDTSVVVRARDFYHERNKDNKDGGDGGAVYVAARDTNRSSVEVMIKLMTDKVQFDREVDERKVIGSNHIVSILCSSASLDLRDRWKPELEKKLSQFSKYPWGIVMPAASKNLASVLLTERPELNDTKCLFRTVLAGLQNMHDSNRIHADINPRNIGAEGFGAEL